MNTVTVETLRTWLEEQPPLTILDVRPTQEYDVNANSHLTHFANGK